MVKWGEHWCHDDVLGLGCLGLAGVVKVWFPGVGVGGLEGRWGFGLDYHARMFFIS